jgi:putative DNA primase/helicase
MNYETVKTKFEEQAFKLVKHGEFGTLEEGSNLVVEKLPAFKKRHGSVTYKNVQMVDKVFLTKWFLDPAKRKYHIYDFVPPPMLQAENVFNTWSGFQIDKMHATTPTDATPILELVKVLANYEEDSYDYILNWLAHIIQSPGTKCDTALVLKAKKGAGKTTLVDIMKMILGGKLVAETKNPDTDIFGKHGRIHLGKLLVCVDNVQRVKCDNRMKVLVTSHTCVYNPKWLDMVEVKNFSRFIFTTNGRVPIPVKDDDRRYCLIESSDVLCNDTPFWDQFYEKLTLEYGGGMLLAFYLHLKNRDLTKVNWMDFPDTQLRRDVIGNFAL